MNNKRNELDLFKNTSEATKLTALLMTNLTKCFCIFVVATFASSPERLSGYFDQHILQRPHRTHIIKQRSSSIENAFSYIRQTRWVFD